MHVEIDPVPKGLDNGDDSGRKHAPGHSLEATAQGPEGAAAEIAEETAIELEEDPQYFHHLLDDQPEKTALIRFALEDCKACTPARNDSHTSSGTCRNDGRVSGKGPCAPDGEGDKFLAHRKGLFKKRAGSRPGTIRRLGGGLVNEQLRPGSRR